MAGRRRPYAPRVPAAQRRDQVLDAALSVLVDSGLSAVTMDAVAARAGVTKPVVYTHFANRDEVLESLLDREKRRAMNQLRQVMAEVSDVGTRFDLAALFDGYLGAVREAPERWRCILIHVPGLPRRVQDVRDRARRAVVEGVAAALESMPGHAGVDVEVLAHFVVSSFEEAGVLVLTDPESFTPDRFVGVVRELAATFVKRN
ncbi:TetR/AcrR family transcriptional regulator [Gordonia aurantiaca]|uniref:TetR/AcrR family transcriptional regulator n=1 Tax=Gordonia sp. B21 TaxID=3151852 RepID=UPI003265D8DA